MIVPKNDMPIKCIMFVSHKESTILRDAVGRWVPSTSATPLFTFIISTHCRGNDLLGTRVVAFLIINNSFLDKTVKLPFNIPVHAVKQLPKTLNLNNPI